MGPVGFRQHHPRTRRRCSRCAAAPAFTGAPPRASSSDTSPLADFRASFGNAPPPITPAPASAADPTRADIEQNKVFAILAYLGILFLVPLLAAPQSPFARYHTNQGIILFITSLIVYPASMDSWFSIGIFHLWCGAGIAVRTRSWFAGSLNPRRHQRRERTMQTPAPHRSFSVD